MTDIQAMSLCMVVIVQLASCNKEWKRDTFPICNYCICMYVCIYTKRLEGTHVQGINCKNGNSGELLQQVDCEHGTHYSHTSLPSHTSTGHTSTDPRLLVSPPHGTLCLTPGAPVDYQ